MNLNVKIDKYGNLVDMDTSTILVSSSFLFPSSIFTAETIDNYWKVTNQGSGTITSNIFSTFNSGDTITYFFKFYLPTVSYSDKSQIFEIDLDDSDSKDIGLYKKASQSNWSLYLNDNRVDLSLDTYVNHVIQGFFLLSKSNNSVFVNVVIYEKFNTNFALVINRSTTINNITSTNIGLSVGADLHGTGSAKLVEDTRYYEDVTIVINSSNYINSDGLSEIWTNTKNYIAAQLLGKSDVGHTHTKSEITDFPIIPTKTSDLTNDSGFLTSHQDLSGYVPRSGGAVMTDYFLGRSADTGSFMLNGGTAWDKGGSIELFGANNNDSYHQGSVRIQPAKNNTTYKKMELLPNGTWTWTGSACAVSSDSRLKDEIKSIPDEILDAWENLEPKQYKLKSELETNKENAQVHYGWIAQDVESVIKGNRKGSVKNGLWLHEEWGEQKEVSHEEKYTEEVETKDGKTKTVTKTRKVIDIPYRAKGDSYGLRYTECLVVECKYLRRCIQRLTARIEELEKGNNSK